MRAAEMEANASFLKATQVSSGPWGHEVQSVRYQGYNWSSRQEEVPKQREVENLRIGT